MEAVVKFARTRMGLLVGLLSLVLLMAACAPALSGGLDRQDGEVTITVAVDRPMYAVNLTVVDAQTDDGRCLAFGADLSCVLGDINPEAPVTVVVVGNVNEVGCTITGFLNANLSPTSYRVQVCRVQAGAGLPNIMTPEIHRRLTAWG